MTATTGRIAFLLSGGGSTLANLLAAIEAGRLAAEVAVVVSDRDGVGGLDIARQRGLPVAVVGRRTYPGRAAYSRALEEALRPHAPDLVVMGGFLTIIDVPPDLAGRIVNVHPALLPAFGGRGCYGLNVHAQVLAAGVRFTGCTVHFADGGVDTGPIVDQALVKVAPDDTPATLAARVQVAERDLYPRAIGAILAGRVRFEDGAAVWHGPRWHYPPTPGSDTFRSTP